MQKKEKEIELGRQSLHIFVGIAVLLLFYYSIVDVTSMLFIIVSGAAVSVACRKAKLPVISWFLFRFERKKQISSFPGKGVLFFFVGSAIVMAAFEKDVAIASIAILTFGDSLSHVFGVLIGRTRQPFSPKLVEGAVVGSFAGFIAASFFVPFVPALFGSVIAMSIEIFELRVGSISIDDNFVIPVIAGLVMTVLQFF